MALNAQRHQVAPDVDDEHDVHDVHHPLPLTDVEQQQMAEVRAVADALRAGQYIITNGTKELRPEVEALRMQQVSVTLKLTRK